MIDHASTPGCDQSPPLRTDPAMNPARNDSLVALFDLPCSAASFQEIPDERLRFDRNIPNTCRPAGNTGSVYDLNHPDITAALLQPPTTTSKYVLHQKKKAGLISDLPRLHPGLASLSRQVNEELTAFWALRAEFSRLLRFTQCCPNPPTCKAYSFCRQLQARLFS